MYLNALKQKKAGRPFGKKWGQVFRAFQVQSLIPRPSSFPRLYPSSDGLLLCAQSFQVIPCISGKTPPEKKQLPFSLFVFLDCSSVSSVHH